MRPIVTKKSNQVTKGYKVTYIGPLVTFNGVVWLLMGILVQKVVIGDIWSIGDMNCL